MVMRMKRVEFEALRTKEIEFLFEELKEDWFEPYVLDDLDYAVRGELPLTREYIARECRECLSAPQRTVGEIG